MLFDVNWFRMTALKGCLEVFEMVPVERILKEQIKSWNSDELFIGMTILLTIIADILLVPWLHIVKTVYKRIFACKLTNNICVIILVRCRRPHLLFATRLHTSYLGWCRESAEGPAT